MILYKFEYSNSEGISYYQCEAVEKEKIYIVNGRNKIKKEKLDKINTDKFSFPMYSLSNDVQPYREQLLELKKEELTRAANRIKQLETTIKNIMDFNNTAQETLKNIENQKNQLGFCGNLYVTVEEYFTIVDALQKQIPVKQKYDANGNETYREYSDGFWAKYEYDSRGNVTYCEWSDGFWEKSEYDENGNCTYYENSHGDWEKWEYDENGNETYWETSDSDGYWQKREYDDRGNVTYYEDSDGNKRGTPRAELEQEPKITDD